MADPVLPTAEEIAEYEKLSASAAPQTINPIKDLSADDLFKLATEDSDNFDLITEFRRNQDTWKDPATIQKIAEVNNRIKQRGFELSDIPGPGKIARTVFDIAKGFGKQAWNYANALVGVPIASAIGEVTGDANKPGFTEELQQEGQRRVMENLAGTEAGMFGVARLGEKAIRKVTGAASNLTPEQKVSDLWKDVGTGATEEAISQGKGGLLEPVGGAVRAELEAAGKPIRPEEVQVLAAGDPAAFYTFGKIFQGAGKLVPGKVAAGAEKVVEKAGRAAEVATGTAVRTLGNLTELGGKAVRIAGPAVGFVKGAIEAGPLGALAGLKGGEIAAKVGGKLSKVGHKVAEVGKDIAGKEPVAGATRVAREVAGATPAGAYEISKGLAFDIGTAALTSEGPKDTQSVGIGAFFGGLGVARRVGRAAAEAGQRVISGQIVGPREWGSETYVPSSGQHDNFENMHVEAVKNATPAVKTRLNAIRQFLQGSHTDTDIFLAKDSPTLEKVLIDSGISPDKAKTWSAQEGFFTANIPGKDGQPRRVILTRNVDAAPHESFHAIQDVLGETANQAIDQIVREEYGPQWEVEGQRYADRITPGGDWRETVLDETGTGLNYAKEKVSMDVANEYRAATGAEPPSGYVQARAKEVLGGVMDRAVQANPGVDPNTIASRVWRDILSAQEATAVADSYLARELAAENFDMVFKNLGASLDNQGLVGRLARIVAQLTSALGGEPLSPETTSQIGDVAPRFRVTEAVRGAPSLVQPREAVTSKPQISLPSGKPSTPNEPLPSPPSPPTDPNADEARTIAAGAPETTTVAGTQSPREILGQVAEAISQQAGIKINYLSAPDEPAAATTSNREARRAIIETFRTMPAEARALWEKTFFPERVVKLKGDKYQVLGWAPEVFAANAHKLAAKLVELNVADASPYPIEGTTFTPEGWQELFKDTQRFVQNQVAGRTGAGEPLVVPKNITEAGFFAPAQRGGVAGLDQVKADFINMLFNFRLPDTARVQKGKLPLNIAAQDVSAATKPGRVEIPVIPRGKFEGPEAQRQGIEGRDIMEVNPLRQQIEAAAQAKGVAMPEFIEAVQRLNLENIKDVQVAPEVPQFRGNTLTLSAGFQPNASPRAIKSAAVREKRTKKVFEGIMHADAQENAHAAGIPRGGNRFGRFEDGFVTNEGEFLNREEAFQRARELEQIPEGFESSLMEPRLEAMDFEGARQFQPNAAPRAVKSAAVKDERGKVWEGFWHGDAEQNGRVAGAKGPFADGFTTNDGEFLTREAAFDRAKELNQISEDKMVNNRYSREPGGLISEDLPRALSGLETSQLPKLVRDAAVDKAASAKFQPPKNAEQAEELVKSIAKMSPQEFNKWAQETPGGLTEAAYQTGFNSSNQGFVNLLKAAGDSFGKKAESLVATDIEAAMIVATQQQFFNEAWQAATGEGSAGYSLRKKDPNFQPKFPLDKAAVTEDTVVQMQPEKDKSYHRVLEEMSIQPSMRKEYGEAADFLDSGFTKEEWEALPYANQKLVHSIAQFKRDWASPFGSNKNDRERRHPFSKHAAMSMFDDIPDFSSRDTSFKGTRDTAEPGEIPPVQFQPKKELKLKPAGQDGVSKAWVLPDGKVVNIGGQWHHEYLNDNPALRKQYKLSDDTSQDNRLGALKKGFARLNWSFGNGHLTIEARTKDWPKQREVVRNFVEANADKIDRMQVVLLSDNLKKVDDANEVSVFTLEDNEKAAMLPFSDLGEKRATGQASDRLFEKAASKAQMQPKFDESVRTLAEDYSEKTGIEYVPPTGYVKYDRDLAKRIAKAYDDATHSPEDPEVVASYDAFKKEVLEQFEAIKEAGFDLEPVISVESPYKNGADVARDVRENKHLFFNLSESAFGPEGSEISKSGLMLEPSGVTLHGKELVINDLFRAIHDFFGHANAGLSFGPRGEFNAWREHSALFSEAAQGALAAETIGQTAWTQVGPHLLSKTGEILKPGDEGFTPRKDRPYAEQKNFVLPKELLNEARGVQFQPKRDDKDLFGVEEVLTPREISKLPRADLLEIYPEAIVPKDPNEAIHSKIVESPLYKNSEDPVQAFSDGLVKFAQEVRSNPIAKAGAEWYDKFTPMLKKEFGKDAQLFAELLAATSPNTGVETNFGYALDALDSFKSGRFEKTLEKFNQGMDMIANDTWKAWYNKELKNIPEPPKKPTAATFLEHWIFKHDLKPKQTNGKLYGIHSLPVLQVFARKWLTDARGPKTLNFVENLIGKSDEATIDMWADRTMRRIGYEGVERWRILPKNIGPVSDKDFAFSQQAFNHAAKRLGMKPSALQGMLWFAEKQLWADNKWADAVFGDFRKEMETIPARRAKREGLTSVKEDDKVQMNLIEPRKTRYK